MPPCGKKKGENWIPCLPDNVIQAGESKAPSFRKASSSALAGFQELFSDQKKISTIELKKVLNLLRTWRYCS